MASPEGISVFLIEDDPDTCANMRDIVELDGHRLTAVHTAADALRHAELKSAAVILVDRRLPDGNAEELLPRLKRLTPEAEVIVVTGHGDLESAIAALRAGATDYLLKPIYPEALRASLSRIAEHRRLQRRLVQAERLAAIGQMVAGLAHESRNALQRSQACLELLALEVEDRPEALDLVSRIQKAQEHLHHLYEEVRGYAAPIKLHRQPCDLREIWQETWSYILETHHKSARLRDDSQGVDLTCDVDRHAISQVFRNILENCVTATDEPVEVVIRCAAGARNGAQALSVSVRDNGPGIAPEQLAKVFEPFFTTKTQGTGLGMAIAKRIVESHGGEIRASNHPAGGAEIEFILPRHAP